MESSASLRSFSAVEHAEPRERAEVRERHVPLHGQPQDQPLLLAILRQEPNPGTRRSHR